MISSNTLIIKITTVLQPWLIITIFFFFITYIDKFSIYILLGSDQQTLQLINYVNLYKNGT